MQDFSREKPLGLVEFTLDGDTFQAVDVAPGMTILGVAKINDAKNLGKIEIIMEFLDQVLLPDSATKFAARLKSAANPITIDQASNIAVWLVEKVYVTERPTQGPSSSQDGSSTTGQSLTDGAQATVTTLEPQSRRVL